MREIRDLGYPFLGWRTARAICLKFLDLALNPKATLEKALRRLGPGGVELGDGIF
jgi:hypothetical protein